jgi:hypothetical protein
MARIQRYHHLRGSVNALPLLTRQSTQNWQLWPTATYLIS